MTGHGNVAFSAAERAALRAYLIGGGFLQADDNYGPPVHPIYDGNPPQGFGIFYGGRLVVIDDPPEIREQALRMGVNIFLYASGQAAT
jgi:hypothetical protein